ncbi:MAG: hypothetical protein AB4372_32095 [Xenococcus sp. (in: cyanobacteria)]
MPDVLLKTGELIEVPEEEMLSFLQENRDLIQDRVSPRRRSIKRPHKVESVTTNTR